MDVCNTIKISCVNIDIYSMIISLSRKGLSTVSSVMMFSVVWFLLTIYMQLNRITQKLLKLINTLI